MSSPVSSTTTITTTSPVTTSTNSTTSNNSRIKEICKNARNRANAIEEKSSQTVAQITAITTSTTPSSLTSATTITSQVKPRQGKRMDAQEQQIRASYRARIAANQEKLVEERKQQAERYAEMRAEFAEKAKRAEEAALAAATPDTPGIRFVPKDHRPMTGEEVTNELMGLLAKLEGQITFRQGQALEEIINGRLAIERRNPAPQSESPIMAPPMVRKILERDNLRQREVWVNYLLSLNPDQFIKIYDDVIQTRGSSVQLGDGTKRALNEHEIIFVMIVFEQIKNKRYGHQKKDFALYIAKKDDSGIDTSTEGHLKFCLAKKNLDFWAEYHIEMEQKFPIAPDWASYKEEERPDYFLIRAAAQKRFEILRDSPPSTDHFSSWTLTKKLGISEEEFEKAIKAEKRYQKIRWD